MMFEEYLIVRIPPLQFSSLVLNSATFLYAFSYRVCSGLQFSPALIHIHIRFCAIPKAAKVAGIIDNHVMARSGHGSELEL